MINLLFTGDFIPPEDSAPIYEDELKSFLKNKDYSITNLETPLTTGNLRIEKTGNNFKRSPGVIRHIKDGYFDAVALSNNHIRDYGDIGVVDTIKVCRSNGIQTVGAGDNIKNASIPLRLKIKGKRIAILNFSEREFNVAAEKKAGANPFDFIQAYYSIKEEKQNNDFVIVIYHGGLEYVKYPTPHIVKLFQFLIDVGADTVVSHHTHYYSGLVQYKEKPIFYGLGNFFSPSAKKDINLSRGVIAKITIDENDCIKPLLIPIIHNMENNKLTLAKESIRDQINNEISDISNTIMDNIKLKAVWQDYFRNKSNLLLSQLASNSKTEYRLRKYVPFFNRFTNYRLLHILNLMRCDAHWNKSVKIIEDLLNTRELKS